MVGGSTLLSRTSATLRPKLQAALHTLDLIAREPLAHFVVAGLALFLAASLYQSQTNQYRIVVTAAHVAELANAYALQFGDKPDGPTLDALVKRDVHDEVLYREAKALKLDQGDQIVRRRVVQKMLFLTQDLNAPAEPTDVQLQAYYDAHAVHYGLPARATFSHIYFSADNGGG